MFEATGDVFISSKLCSYMECIPQGEVVHNTMNISIQVIQTQNERLLSWRAWVSSWVISDKYHDNFYLFGRMLSILSGIN